MERKNIWKKVEYLSGQRHSPEAGSTNHVDAHGWNGVRQSCVYRRLVGQSNAQWFPAVLRIHKYFLQILTWEAN